MRKIMKAPSVQLLGHLFLLTLLGSTACTHHKEQLLGAEDFSKEESTAANDSATDLGETTGASDLSSLDTSATNQTGSADDLFATAQNSTPSSSETTEQENSSTTASSENVLTTNSTGVASDTSTSSSSSSSVSSPGLAESQKNSETGTTTELSQSEGLLSSSTSSLDNSTADNTQGLGSQSTTNTSDFSSLGTETNSASTDSNSPSTLPSSLSISDSSATAAGTPSKVSSEKRTRSALPNIPTKTVKKGKHVLNRYYFLRKTDTAKTLSQLFYGDDSHAQEIVKWNGSEKTWKAGKLMFYISADQPDDTEMDSFYHEQGVTGENYLVKTGDQLASIAKEKYGDVMSWKEIAIHNKLQSPHALNPGDTLVLLPHPLKSAFERKASLPSPWDVAAGASGVKSPSDIAATATSPSHIAATSRSLTPSVTGSEASQKLSANAPNDTAGNDSLFDEEVGLGKSPVRRNQQSARKLSGARELPEPSQVEKSKDNHLAAMDFNSTESNSSVFSILVGVGLLLVAGFLFLMRRARERALEEFME